MEAGELNKYTAGKTAMIDDLLTKLDSKVSKAQERVYRELLAGVLDKLDVKDGAVQNTPNNMRLLSGIDKVFNNMGMQQGLEVVNDVISGVDAVIGFNGDYFGALFDEDVSPLDYSVRSQMGDWLGIKQGKLAPNGYLDKIVKDSTIRNGVKDILVKNVVAQRGFAETRKQMQDYMVGKDADSLGKLQQYYRNLVYDTYSVADRVVGMQYADSKGLNFAVYEGGTIKTSREFCVKRNGKVFHRDEIAKFNPTTAKPPSYNPYTDLGGYACRHHLNWITDKMAVRMRPDAIDFEINELYNKAQAGGKELQSIAERIAKENGGKVTPINYKSKESIKRKVTGELGMRVSDVKDAVRNTIVVPKDKIAGVIEDLKKTGIVQRVKAQQGDTFYGYSGNIINVKLSDGTIGEVQVNTEHMIFAKEKRADAERVIGAQRWQQISKEVGLDGGLGHEYYEKIRVCKEVAELRRLAILSKEYYSHFNKK